MVRQADALLYSVRAWVVLKYTGQLLVVLALLSTVPLVGSIIFGDGDLSLRYAFVVTGLGASGLVLGRLKTVKRIQTNEALVVSALVFAIAPLCMTYPLMGTGLTFTDALFEAVSGATTTGLSTLATVEGQSTTFLFARAWMQWYGGLGIVVLSLALLFQPGPATREMSERDDVELDLVGSTRAYALRILQVYCVITILGIGALLLAGASAFDSIVYTLAAVSTGGFAPHDASLGGLPTGAAEIIVLTTCVAGAIALPLYRAVLREGPRHLLRDRELMALLACTLVGTIALGAISWGIEGHAMAQVLREAPATVVSAQTTAGFSAAPPGEMDDASKLVLIVSMFIGGESGSTAGGIKLIRLLVFLRCVQLLLVRTALPKEAVVRANIGNVDLSDQAIVRTLVVILLFALVNFVSWLPFVAMGYPALDSLFDVVSATGTVGLSTGVVSTELPWFLKAILCADMWLGRLEIVAWLVVLSPRTWLGKRARSS